LANPPRASGEQPDAGFAEQRAAAGLNRTPDGLDTVAEAPRKASKRDVYLYVISGFKVRNPAAGMAIIERLGKAV